MTRGRFGFFINNLVNSCKKFLLIHRKNRRVENRFVEVLIEAIRQRSERLTSISFLESWIILVISSQEENFDFRSFSMRMSGFVANGKIG